MSAAPRIDLRHLSLLTGISEAELTCLPPQKLRAHALAYKDVTVQAIEASFRHRVSDAQRALHAANEARLNAEYQAHKARRQSEREALAASRSEVSCEAAALITEPPSQVMGGRNPHAALAFPEVASGDNDECEDVRHELAARYARLEESAAPRRWAAVARDLPARRMRELREADSRFQRVAERERRLRGEVRDAITNARWGRSQRQKNVARREVKARRAALADVPMDVACIERRIEAHYKCARVWARTECEGMGGHRIAKRLHCGRRGCTIEGGCGALHQEAEGSEETRLGPILARMCSRAIKKLEWAAYLAYVVLTVPLELRWMTRTREGRKDLDDLTNEVTRILYPHAPGVMTSIHDYGDKSELYHPHGNGIAPLPPNTPWKWTEAGMKIAKEHVAQRWGIPAHRVVIHAVFKQPNERWHTLRYVLRDTVAQHVDHMLDEDAALLFGTFGGIKIDPMKHADEAQGLKTRHGVPKLRWYGKLSTRSWGRFSKTELVVEGTKANPMSRAEDKTVRQVEDGMCPACDCALGKWTREKELDMKPPVGLVAIADEAGLYATPETIAAMKARAKHPPGGAPP